MSEPVRGIVIAHGELASAMIEAAERIGGQQGALVAVSNDGCGREEIAGRLAEAAGSGPAVVFVDMPCGSCFFAAMHLAHERTDVRVVTGVNLPMLLDFLNNRALPPGDGVVRAAEKGADAIRKG